MQIIAWLAFKVSSHMSLAAHHGTATGQSYHRYQSTLCSLRQLLQFRYQAVQICSVHALRSCQENADILECGSARLGKAFHQLSSRKEGAQVLLIGSLAILPIYAAQSTPQLQVLEAGCAAAYLQVTAAKNGRSMQIGWTFHRCLEAH